MTLWKPKPLNPESEVYHLAEVLFSALPAMGEDAHVTVAMAATAIEREGIYTWDRFGRFMRATDGPEDDECSVAAALKALADYYRIQSEGYADADEYFFDSPGSPFYHYAWRPDQLPDFAGLEQERLKKETGRPDAPRAHQDPAPQSSYREILRGLVAIHWPEAKEELNKPRTELIGKIQKALERQGVEVSAKTLRAYLKE
ncbi:hypothetical protein [Thiohalocapsa marina]|uniref:hypothetical protein n=1 Tax=Thiohalocapsa marina TaxID=424902 RepID=UPI0036D9CA84